MFLDRHNGFVTLKDFELPDDGFNWGAEKRKKKGVIEQ
jgi:hypothetical protein